MPLNNSDAASYVLKYNLKSEPSFTTEVDKSILKARYVSAEESKYRIFSVDMCNKDVRVIYQPVYPPDKRKAMYNIVTGKQVQLNGIEKYFHRPRALENISFLEFYSLFDIAVVKEIDVSSVPPDFYDFDLESIPNPNRFKNENLQEYIPNTFMMGFCLNDYSHPKYRLL